MSTFEKAVSVIFIIVALCVALTLMKSAGLDKLFDDPVPNVEINRR